MASRSTRFRDFTNEFAKSQVCGGFVGERIPILDRRGGCAIKKMALFLSGADGVVDQALKSIRSASRTFDLSTTPPLAIKNNRSRLPLLSRRGNLPASYGLLGLDSRMQQK